MMKGREKYILKKPKVEQRQKGKKGVTTVSVSLGARSYPIQIGSGMMNRVGAILGQKGFAGKIAVITDSNVYRIYGTAFVRMLKERGFEITKIVLPAGEKTKSLSHVEKILDRLVQQKFERQSLLIALGGGVIGDIAGFAASIFVRGIPFIQIPTTLIAQVDSSVGGKTGVNHQLGKNLIGTFYQPEMVLMDPDTLGTLSKREFTAGMAEVIKYGMIADATFFKFLENYFSRFGSQAGDPNELIQMIRRSCQLKAKVVGEDEQEAGRRRILNYGHTIGHALEALGNYTTLIHGEAVALGMLVEAELAHHLGLCSPQVVTRQQALVARAGLPTKLPNVTATQVWNAMMRDKKVVQRQVHCVFPTRVGAVTIAPIQASVFRPWFQRRMKSESKNKKPRK